jgi:RimJ/RimL family protein N-acetyltransferase
VVKFAWKYFKGRPIDIRRYPMNIYSICPTFESERFTVRLLRDEDCDDLLKVYSDKNALPFFNSDNCNGDIFFYATKEKMSETIGFWKTAYDNGWFARLSIVDRSGSGVIGTVELCLRVSEDAFNHMGILRVDVRSDYEREDYLYEIFSLITPELEEILGCKGVLTKAPIYAVDRIIAIRKAGFTKSEHMLIDNNGHTYDGYWTLNR